VNVATVAVMMAYESKHKDMGQIPMLALGCMVHDIEHYFVDVDLSIPISKRTPEQLVSYKEHPLKGATRLQTAPFVDQMVMNIIMQHEENIKGTGFPKGLIEQKMDPLVIIAATANVYDRLVSFEGMEPKNALKHMMIETLGFYPLEYLQILQKLLKRFTIV
jgi:HD-GYP domain-containing protein (c-di-GMP phosphodiesterase class II)